MTLIGSVPTPVVVIRISKKKCGDCHTVNVNPCAIRLVPETLETETRMHQLVRKVDMCWWKH